GREGGAASQLNIFDGTDGDHCHVRTAEWPNAGVVSRNSSVPSFSPKMKATKPGMAHDGNTGGGSQQAPDAASGSPSNVEPIVVVAPGVIRVRRGETRPIILVFPRELFAYP